MNSNKSKQIFILLFTGVLILVFFLMFAALFSQRKSAPIQTMADGWEVYVNGKMMKNISLEEYSLKSVKKNDELILRHTLPKQLPDNQMVSFVIFLSSVEMYLDDSLFYEYGNNVAAKGNLVGSGYHLAALPVDAAGKTLTIRVVARENDAFTSLGVLTYGTPQDIFGDYIQKNFLSVVICLFLVILGVVMSVFALTSLVMSNIFLKFLPTTIFSFLIGVYGITSMKFLNFYGWPLEVNTTMEYITLYLAPIPITFIFVTMDNISKFAKRMLYVLVSILFAFVVVVTILNYTNVIHYARVLKLFHLLAFLAMLVGACIIIKSIRKSNKKNMFVTWGFIILLLSTFFDLLRFNFTKYFFSDADSIHFSLIPIGALLFIFLQLTDGLFSIHEAQSQQAEKRLLERLAFTDSLCQISNRRRCQQVFEELDEGTQEYSIISFDMNGLKFVNDTMGHLKGDMLLKEFSIILMESFKDVGEVFRMSGDEFLVIVDGDKQKHIEKSMEILADLEETHSAIIDIPISASYGIAVCDRSKKEGADKVYSRADSKMYDMKIEYHKTNPRYART